jgi:hypothetical protein
MLLAFTDHGVVHVVVACLARTLAGTLLSPGWTRVEQLDDTYAQTRYNGTECHA